MRRAAPRRGVAVGVLMAALGAPPGPARGQAGPPDPGVPTLDAGDLDSARLEDERRSPIDQALRAGAYEQAQALLLAEVERSPRSPQLLRLLGGVFFLRGEYLSSAIALKKAEALAPLDPRSRFTLAMSYVVLGRPRWARPELTRLARSDEKNPLYAYWLARLDYEEGHYAAAAEAFRRVLVLDPTFVKAHDNLGLALEALGRDDEAVRSYQEALRLNREQSARSPWPAVNLGILLTRLDRLDEAELLFRASVAEDPRFAPARYQLGLVLEKKARPAEAVAELSRAAELDPRYPEPHYALARLFRYAADPDKADRALERFLALKKEKSQAAPGVR